MSHPDEHECFSYGCKEIVVGRYNCDRHEAILQRQRDDQARRNSKPKPDRAADLYAEAVKRGS